MDRRRYLRGVAGGAVACTAGCAALRGPRAPFRFGIVNRRDRAYNVDFRLSLGDEVLLDGEADVAARPPGDGEFAAVDFDDLARVRNGAVVEARVRVDGRTYETRYEVTCSGEHPANALFFRIRHPDAPASNESGMEFSGNEC